jgi:hypothetical protein
MIENVIECWHRYLRGELPGDSTSYSPTTSCSTHRIVHTPQRGKDVTKRYLTAAGATLFGSDKVNDFAGRGTFRYTKQVAADDRAVLEFETTVRASTSTEWTSSASTTRARSSSSE